MQQLIRKISKRNRHLSRVVVSRSAVGWFQQDGAINRSLGNCEDELFGGKVISKKGAFLWSLRSPNLSQIDLFL